jgi:glycosyltransferase involved in cell wall biosynthesis
MYPHPRDPGYGSFVKEQVEALTALGVECSVITSSESRKGFQYTLPKYLRIVFQTLFAILRTRYDIVHAHYVFPTGIIGAIASRFLRIPFMLTVHGSVEPHYHSSLSRKLMSISLHEAAHIIAVGSSVRDELVRRFTIENSKISIIDMGIDTNLFKSIPQTEARAKLGLPGEGIIFLSIGSLIWRKGLHLYLKSIATYPSYFHRANIIIIGTGPLADELQQMTIEYGIEKVTIAGAVPKNDIPIWLSAADYLVHPALQEGFGLVILEAMSCERIVIASPVGGIMDYLEDGVNGFLFDRWNPGVRSQWEGWFDEGNLQAIANKVQEVLSLPDPQAARIRAAARSTAECRDIAIQAEKVKLIYSGLLDRSNH